MDCLVEENIADTPAQVAVDNDHTVKLSMCTKCTTWCIYNKAIANKICSWCLPQLQVLSLQFSLVGSRSIHHQNKLQRVKTLWMQNTHTLCTYMYLYCRCQNCLCGPLLGVCSRRPQTAAGDHVSGRNISLISPAACPPCCMKYIWHTLICALIARQMRGMCGTALSDGIRIFIQDS